MVVMATSSAWLAASGPGPHVHDEDGGNDGELSGRTTDLQQHLQAMFALLPTDHVLKEVVRLEAKNYRNRVRYLAVVAYSPPNSLSMDVSGESEEETCVLGFDCAPDRAQATLGLVLCLYADSMLTLDGDGGFCLVSAGSQHVFKPVSVHVLWAVLQSLHKACARAQKFNHYAGGTTHRWVDSYRITSDRFCLNEWHYLPDLESRRRPPPTSGDVLTSSSSPQTDQKAELERLLRSTLKEVMMTLDLDVVTSKDIRKRVEEELQLDLTEYKSFMDAEMLIILGQMDGASQIFEDLYLGSEWNASNLEELKRNGIGHILNVTREIDNFFPDQFDYLNIRVYDDEATELLKHWDRTYKYIRAAVESGSKVLVHCKMGVSRSASVVVAYAMKARHWDLPQALRHVKERRACVKPNSSFMQQLEIYAGILDASRQRHNSLWRSKSETNLISASMTMGNNKAAHMQAQQQQQQQQHNQKNSGKRKATGKLPPSVAVSTTTNTTSFSREESKLHSPGRPPLAKTDSPALRIQPVDETTNTSTPLLMEALDSNGESSSGRPKSWSPDDSLADTFFPSQPESGHLHHQHHDTPHQETEANRAVSVSLRVPCSNGRTYSVSQNRAVQLESSPPPPPPPPPLPPPPRPCFSLELDPSPSACIECVNTALIAPSSSPLLAPDPVSIFNSLPRVGSVKDRICELEAAAAQTWSGMSSSSKSALVLHLEPSDPTASAGYFQFSSSTSSSSVLDSGPALSFVKAAPSRHQAVLVSGIGSTGAGSLPASRKRRERQPDQRYKSSDVFSARVDHVFEREERRQSEGSVQRDSPLRQHSWGAGESRTRSAHHHAHALPVDVTALSSGDSQSTEDCWMPSYASDPSLPTSESYPPPASTGRPGLVRMQREALLEKSQRRSMPEERPAPALSSSAPATSTPPLNRSISDSSNSGSVMRLRRELEAKASHPLTGSFAPTPQVVAALSAALTSPASPPTSPLRHSPTNRTRPGRSAARLDSGCGERIRKRSLSLEKVSAYSSLDHAVGVNSPAADWSRASQDATDQGDLNVRHLVVLFETTPSSNKSGQNHRKSERPRGWSESSLPGTARSHHSSGQHQRRSATGLLGGAGKPPIPDPAGLAVQPLPTRFLLAGKERKPYGGKTSSQQHPLPGNTARHPKLAQPVFGTM